MQTLLGYGRIDGTTESRHSGKDGPDLTVLQRHCRKHCWHGLLGKLLMGAAGRQKQKSHHKLESYSGELNSTKKHARHNPGATGRVSTIMEQT